MSGDRGVYQRECRIFFSSKRFAINSNPKSVSLKSYFGAPAADTLHVLRFCPMQVGVCRRVRTGLREISEEAVSSFKYQALTFKNVKCRLVAVRRYGLAIMHRASRRGSTIGGRGPSHQHSLVSITNMKHLLKIKRKKSPEPPLHPIPPGYPADIAVAPSSQVELDAVPEGESSRYRAGVRLP